MSIAIITPSFNQGRFIERTIESVITQSIPQLEYIVMDGGSTDETVTILKRYQSHLSYSSAPDKGQANAVNKGLTQSQGEILGWLNSDDIYYPQAIRKVLAIFEKNADIDVVYGKANHIDEQDKIIQPYPTEEWNLKRLTQTCYLSQPAVFFRRSLLSRFGILNENLHFCLDYEYWLRLGLGGARFYYVQEILAGSRLHCATKTVSAPKTATY